MVWTMSGNQICGDWTCGHWSYRSSHQYSVSWWPFSGERLHDDDLADVRADYGDTCRDRDLYDQEKLWGYDPQGDKPICHWSPGRHLDSLPLVADTPPMMKPEQLTRVYSKE